MHATSCKGDIETFSLWSSVWHIFYGISHSLAHLLESWICALFFYQERSLGEVRKLSLKTTYKVFYGRLSHNNKEHSGFTCIIIHSIAKLDNNRSFLSQVLFENTIIIGELWKEVSDLLRTFDWPIFFWIIKAGHFEVS